MKTLPKVCGIFLALAACAALLQGKGTAGSGPSVGLLSETDRKAIREDIEVFRTAWLAGDEKGVLRTLTEDAVLMPPHASAPVVGIAAIQKYWWPAGGPPTTITRFDISIDQVDGTDTLAFARGNHAVWWSVEMGAKTEHHAHQGTYLNVLRKSGDGRWRIQVHMWDLKEAQ